MNNLKKSVPNVKKPKKNLFKKTLIGLAYLAIAYVGGTIATATINDNIQSEKKTAVFCHYPYATKIIEAFMYLPVVGQQLLNGTKTEWYSDPNITEVNKRLCKKDLEDIVFIGHGNGESFELGDGDFHGSENKSQGQLFKYTCGEEITYLNEILLENPSKTFATKGINGPNLLIDTWIHFFKRLCKGDYGNSKTILNNPKRNFECEEKTISKQIFYNIDKQDSLSYDRTNHILPDQNIIPKQLARPSNIFLGAREYNINIQGINYLVKVNAIDHSKTHYNPYNPFQNNLIISLIEEEKYEKDISPRDLIIFIDNGINGYINSFYNPNSQFYFEDKEGKLFRDPYIDYDLRKKKITLKKNLSPKDKDFTSEVFQQIAKLEKIIKE